MLGTGGGLTAGSSVGQFGRGHSHIKVAKVRGSTARRMTRDRMVRMIRIGMV